MGYTGERSMLRYYIQSKRKMRPSKRTVRFETQPGYQLQHDWGEVEVEVARQWCKVNFAVNTLGFSRRFHVFAAPKQDAEHTYESLYTINIMAVMVTNGSRGGDESQSSAVVDERIAPEGGGPREKILFLEK
ncbi:putative transposase [Escherichia coli DEC10F]|nr:putative transposase [Escherichia coli DEC10F]